MLLQQGWNHKAVLTLCAWFSICEITGETWRDGEREGVPCGIYHDCYSPVFKEKKIKQSRNTFLMQFLIFADSRSNCPFENSPLSGFIQNINVGIAEILDAVLYSLFTILIFYINNPQVLIASKLFHIFLWKLVSNIYSFYSLWKTCCLLLGFLHKFEFLSSWYLFLFTLKKSLNNTSLRLFYFIF